MQVIFAIAGLFIGLSLGRNGGWMYGLLAGFAIGAWVKASSELNELRRKLKSMQEQLDALRQKITTPRPEKTEAADKVETPAATRPVEATKPEPIVEPQPEPTAVAETKPVVAREQTRSEQTKKEDNYTYTPPPPPLPIDIAIRWFKNFFTSGNVMVKIGVTVLFFGVAFLVKYASDHNMFPIELRLAAVSLLGIVMLGTGWYLRDKKQGYALVIQGGALAILYLTVFAALRLYALLPAEFAFALLFVFAAFSATLAILQDSRSLAILALSGGFLAPILTSSGSNNYVALFSYYLILNLAVFAIAWFRSWRILNILGFLFTFVISTLWGFRYYTAADFPRVEPFLIAFYLLYVGITILYAIRQPVHLKGYVDSTLIFGVPLAGFSLQAAMVYHIEYALAWSSLALAAFYIALASILWQKLKAPFRLICEAFIALGVMFATLAVPFAMDASWTSGTWALEGAAAVWIGVRQARLLPRLAGYVLQVASTVTWLDMYSYNTSHTLFILNAHYLGALMIALCGIFIAWQLFKAEGKTHNDKPVLIPQEKNLSRLFLNWGLAWWTLAGVHEVEQHIRNKFQPLSLILFATFSASLAQLGKQRLRWPGLQSYALLLLPVLVLLFPYVLLNNKTPFESWLLPTWIIAFALQLWILKRYEDEINRFIRLLHMGSYWLLVLLLTTEATLRVDRLYLQETWVLIMTGLIPALSMLLLYLYGHKISWPVRAHRTLYQIDANKPLAAIIGGWFVIMNLFNSGNPAPLPYLPLLNPLDLVLAIQLVALLYWLRIPLDFEQRKKGSWRIDWSRYFVAISIFIWLNSMWLRLAHHQWGIHFDPASMLQSQFVQTGLAILWSVTGLSCMLFGNKRHNRGVWIAGAIVMAAVVIKLFMFDLANTGTVERIVSFISVGGLLLVVGYFAPVPPAKDSGKETENA